MDANLFQTTGRHLTFTLSDKSRSPEILDQRKLPHITTPSPEPQHSLKHEMRRICRLPVLAYHSKADKKLVAGIRLQNVTSKSHRIIDKIQSYVQETTPLARSSGPKKTPVIAAQPPHFQIKHDNKKPVVKSTVKPAAPGTMGGKVPLVNPAPQKFKETRVNKPKESHGFQKRPQNYPEGTKELINPTTAKKVLVSALENLSASDWEKHIEGLLEIEALAQDHSTILKENLQQVCVKVNNEISSNRSTLSCKAMETMGVLYEHMQPDMDRFVALTGTPLLARIASLQVLRVGATDALEKMVKYCSGSKVLDFLLSKGMSHRSSAVRDGAAYLLVQLADKLGSMKVLKSKTFITAVSQMCLDASPAARAHGYGLLHDLDNKAGKEKLMSLIDAKDRGKIMANLKKTKKQER